MSFGAKVVIFRDLVKKLLQRDQFKRLGNLKNGAADVMNHKWFADIRWDDVAASKLMVNSINILFSTIYFFLQVIQGAEINR